MNRMLTQKELREWIDVAWSKAVKKSKYTPWFHPTETPERVGVYQRIRWNDDDAFFSYWDGRRWWPSGVTADEAFERYVSYLPYGVPRWVSQVLQWRGIKL